MKYYKFALRALVLAFVLVTIVAEEKEAAAPEADKGAAHSFQTEVTKMLDILINSLYTNRSIFLREVISNGSDALDKIRFLYLTAPQTPKNDAGEEPTMDIRISVDKDKRTLTIRDGGVGMTKEELGKNLGTLGLSGTKDFVEKLKESSDANFIGQFGVGFYSVFLVSDNVRVASKHDSGDKQWVWESRGDGKYFLYEDSRGNTLGRGTELTLELKKDADEYLETTKLKEIVQRYSEFIHFPIYVEVTKTEKVPKKQEDKSDEEKKPEEEGEVKDESEKKDEEKKEEEMEEVTTKSWELINENKPIWTRKPSDITEDEYNKFYKSMSKDYADPMYYSHFRTEGEVEFKSILYIPTKAPGNVFETSTTNNIRLYVRRVFITDEFKDLLPRYLNFVRGVVDSDDLPLNVSRELLQESRILKIIKKKLVRKALGMFADIAANDKKIAEKNKKDEEKKDEADEKKDEEKKDDEENEGKEQKEMLFDKFWEEYGKNIRLGLIEDGSNRARLTKLLRYKSSKSEDKLISLDDYVDRMPATQKNIFYITGASIEKIKEKPVVEDALKRNVEVLFMFDAIDEYVVGHLTDYTGKKLVNLAKEGVKLGEDDSSKDKKIDAKRKEKYEPLTKWFKSILGEKVTKVVITKRFTSEPLILTSPQHGLTAEMARILKGQALGEKGSEHEAKKIVELNHLHPIVDDIYKRIKVDEKDKVAEDAAIVLYETAALQGGFDIDNVGLYAKRVNRMLRSGMDLGADAGLIDEDLSEYEVEEDKEEEKKDGEEGKAGEDEAPKDEEKKEDL
jgi:HSP90 family molecular chaperone